MSDAAAEVDTPVRHERDARGVHRLTLNTPKSFNVLSEAVLTELQRQLDLIAADRARACWSSPPRARPSVPATTSSR